MALTPYEMEREKNIMENNREIMKLCLLDDVSLMKQPSPKKKKAKLTDHLHIPMRQRYERESKKNKSYTAPKFTVPSDDDFEEEEEEEEEVPDEENFSDAEMETLLEEIVGLESGDHFQMQEEDVYKYKMSARRGRHVQPEETLPPIPYPLLDSRGICLLRMGHLDLSFAPSLCSRSTTSIQKLINAGHMEQLPCGAYKVLSALTQLEGSGQVDFGIASHNLFLDAEMAQLCHKLRQRFPFTHPSNVLSFLCSRKKQDHIPNQSALPSVGTPPSLYGDETVGLYSCDLSSLSALSSPSFSSLESGAWSFLALHRMGLLREWHSHGQGGCVSVFYYRTNSKEDVMKVCLQKELAGEGEGLEYLYQDALPVYDLPSPNNYNLVLFVYSNRLLCPRRGSYCVYKKDACPCGILTSNSY